MSLTVDGHADEVKQFSGDTEWLGNSFAYVGGTLPHRNYIPGFSQSFRGCMKKIRYEADAQLLDIIELADQGFGQSIIRTGGDLSFSCQPGRLSPAPDVLSFNSGHHYISLAKWNSPSGGSIGFQFRTGESDALLMFHGLKKMHNQTHGDYLAFEIIDGHLYLILNLGSGVVRLQTTSQRVDDPRIWHSVQLERLGRGGIVIVDHLRTDFSTPGVSANLQIDEPIFIGSIPWKDYDIPSTIWSAHLKKEITIGCPSLAGSDYCASDPCLNGGICRNGHTTYHCDCSKTHFEGSRCNDEPLVFSFARRHGDGPRIRLSKQRTSQAEDVEFKFRTEDDRAIFMDTSATNTTDRFRLSLDRGRLQLRLSINSSRQNYGWGENLNDNQWHTVKISRRGEKLKLFVDGKWENHYSLSENQLNLHIDEISVAEPLQSYDGDSDESLDNDDFAGDMILATFNEIDLLEDVKLRQRTSSEEKTDGQRLKHRKVKSSTVWFDT
uniref:Neurexin n=1 Tax=Panagrolaimus sp. JU765 TaxID=591449 RepID=A0AC34Q392_9BILA